ncbi:papain family cysteine protease [Necator americanus]|uniref:Papain family cysteine protease n=1 Tax=Necator americanus TaxID=51031 RepID=W2SLZ6_NECAM|nr:papain family cysteine protease [Necator americanus]ETN70699.1 papain family cysteine protease [Necator americanus]
MTQSAMDEIALVPTVHDETTSTSRADEPVHVVTSRTDSRKAKLAKKYQRTPLAFYQALALGALLLILILNNSPTLFRNTNRVSDGTNPHSQDDETYHLSIVEEVNSQVGITWKARYNKFASRAEANTGTGADADTARMILNKFFNLDDEQLLQDTVKHVEGLSKCQGTHWALSAFTYWKEHGIVSGGAFGTHEGCRPYTFEPSCGTPCGSALYRKDRTPRCERQCQNLYHRTYEQDLVQARTAYWLRAINGSSEYTPVVKTTLERLINGKFTEILQRELMTYGPVLACFTLYEDFQHYMTGIYRTDENRSLQLYGHCAKLIGWGEESGLKYWLYANTWGRDWGEHGFFRIDMNEIPEEVVAGVM